MGARQLDAYARAPAPSAPFPFRATLDLTPLLDYWRGLTDEANPWLAGLARDILRDAERRPELFRPLAADEVHDVVARHRGLVDAMMAAIFPSSLWDSDLAAVTLPFHLTPIVATPGFRERFIGPDQQVILTPRGKALSIEEQRLLHAYMLIAREVYGYRIGYNHHRFVFEVKRPTSLPRYYTFEFDPRFSRIEFAGEPPPLDDAAMRAVQDNYLDLAAWRRAIPAERFHLTGFAFVRAYDVTQTEVVTDIKQLLIDRDSVVSTDKFGALEERLRVLLDRASLRLCLSALLENGGVMQIRSGQSLQRVLMDARDREDDPTFSKSLYGRSIDHGGVSVFTDLACTAQEDCCIDRDLLDLKARDAIIAPLSYKNQHIGFLELWSDKELNLEESQACVLSGVLPLISLAVQRGLDEMAGAVESIIKRLCTAIHPTVEWRFREAALQAVHNGPSERVLSMEPIVFRDVYPLFAVSDIRGSSSQRSAAIQADLEQQLRRLAEIVATAVAAQEMPALGHLAFRIGRMRERIAAGLSAGDEIGVLAFADHEVEPIVRHLASLNPDVAGLYDRYRNAVDQRYSGIYDARQRFDRSVSRLNERLAACLDQGQKRAQSVFPHYFERSITDGVDHCIYVGESLVDGRAFDKLYVRDLRIWQLEMLVDCARATEDAKASQPLPLDTAHLVVVQDTPLSISFDYEEKRFGVDGAYNVRYEIMKKRIDKAVVQGTGQRLTQPRQIAVVYSQERERNEYLSYLDYLKDRRLLHGDIEELQLQDMQGVQGLHALRVGVVV